ncbi:MAG: asparagine synthase (glutamine-hydrolyzing) [Phycisphaerales bacterium JB039]
MCGILGIAAPLGREPSVTAAQVARLRDLMTHRGPDGAGLLRDRGVILAHRRLAVLDLTDAGAQPMTTPDGRFTLVYNGELYNEADLRARLADAGIRPHSACDSETVLLALATWGPGALDRFRGMYALALFDRVEQTLLLAIDPLAIKPLYWAIAPAPGGPELIFASEIDPVARHPHILPRPDPVVVSSYLTTIRTTLGDRTMLAGVRTLTPGQRLLFDLRDRNLVWKSWAAPAVQQQPAPADSPAALREQMLASVQAHLRSDAPICALLSGGLDSAVITRCARDAGAHLRTYCAGARPGPDSSETSDDFHFALAVAADLGAAHHEVPVTRALFAGRWREIIERTGQPLSTPNEVAINEVARRLRADGYVVTLSGEGADELLAGYTEPMRMAARHAAAGGADPGRFQLESAAWIPPDAKAGLLREDIWRAAERDELLTAFYRDEYSAAAAEPGADDPLEAALRFHRRINLAGLLRRLDSATMLESVEGRTPFADRAIASLCAAIPMREKFVDGDPPQSKLALRCAFAGAVRRPVLERPKASFPLPFARWLEPMTPHLADPGPALDLFNPAGLGIIAARPAELWRAAWPVVNLVLWTQRWWG